MEPPVNWRLGLQVTPNQIPKIRRLNLYVLNAIEILFYLFIREEFLQKIERRVKEYKIEVMNEPRPGKKLLVLDVDYTLFGKTKVILIVECNRFMVPFIL